MARVKVSTGIELEYEVFGDAEAPTIVLVMGLAMQLTAWDERFCERLADCGYRVVRFDNRDVGLSTKLDPAGFPDFLRATTRDRSAAPYFIEDMADDLEALIVALGVPAAHIVGLSMGGFIVQEAVLRHPGRVLSVASIMSSTGDPRVGQATPEALAVVMAPPPHDREGAVEQALVLWRVIGTQSSYDATRIRRETLAAFDRNVCPGGVARQVAAILTQRDRTEVLAQVRVPTVVIHGTDDPLIDISGGEATAAAIPGARLVEVDGLGHDLPEEFWPVIIDAIVDNARRAGA